jgi:hypothetical protein
MPEYTNRQADKDLTDYDRKHCLRSAGRKVMWQLVEQ